MKLLTVIFQQIFFYSLKAYPFGAPISSCDTLLPNHGSSPQDSESHYQIITSKTSLIGGETLQVTIQGLKSFRGFIVAARASDGKENIGDFFLHEEETQPILFRNCSNGLQNVVTHANNELKDKISFNWNAPYNLSNSIRIYATIVEDKSTFWVNQMSDDEITITSAVDEIYEGCGTSKSCFGLPDGCIISMNCISFGAVIVKNGVYAFQLKSTTQTINRASYIAFGLSSDNRMGQDSVIECVNTGNTVSVFTSLTIANSHNFGARRTDINQNIIRVKESRIENGAINCIVERDAVSEVSGTVYNLINQSFHLVIASGSTASELSIGYHDINRDASREAIRFAEDNPMIIRPMNQQPSENLLLFQGSFMIIAWISAMSIGVFSARYFKKIWIGKQLFGKDVWFIIHHVAISLTWVLTISAAIIICSDVGKWPTSTHLLLGIIATVLCFIHPFIAFFQPPRDHERSSIFDFIQGSIGKLAHIIAVIAIFFSTSMARADLPSWTKSILVSYVIVYLIFYVIFTNMVFNSDIKPKQLLDYLMEAERSSSQVKNAFERRVLVILFSFIVLGFLIILINALILDTLA